MTDPVPGRDPILVRRARIESWVRLGQRVGYGLFGAAVALFVIGFAAGFTSPVTAFITVCLVLGSLILAPAIVFHYGVRAAAREEAGTPRPGH